MKAFVVALFVLIAALACGSALRTQQNVPFEVTFHSQRHHADPFNQVSLDAVFTDPDGVQERVPAFWDGGATWKVRYASPILGRHKFKTICSDPADKGLNGRVGSITVARYSGSNPLYKHGPIRVAPDKRHFDYADGTPFFWLGDTWWMGLAKRLEWPQEFQALTADRVAKGFTVVQIVAGLYPDMPPFDPRGANEAGFPWAPGYARINPAYFDHADVRLKYLVEHGIMPCVVGSWGYYMTWMSVDQLERHWRNLIARYGAEPVVWCGCGEVDMPWYLAKRSEYNRQDRMRKWTEVVRYIRRTDPFHRLLTLHPDGLSARDTIDDPSLLDFDMLQTGHGLADAARSAAKATAATYAATPQMPFVNGESSYENLNNEIPAAWTRATFWISMLNGAAGHTYGANGIWQNNRPGDPHGKSPSGNNWGTASSQEAMHFPGSTQESLGKRLFEEFPWQSFRPHPEWAQYADDSSGSGPNSGFAKSHWIWYPEGLPAVDAPVAARYFRLAFDVPGGKSIASADLRLSADDAFVAYLNGKKIGESTNWRAGAYVGGLETLLKPGRNVLAVRAENLAADVRQNPAGLIATLDLHFSGGASMALTSDSSWGVSQDGAPGWNLPGFDDADWKSAMVVAAYGDGPWGRFDDSAPPIAVVSAGIPDRVRFSYAQQPNPIEEAHLGAWRAYRATLFDPTTGKLQDLGEMFSDGAGQIVCKPPVGWDHDWLLVMEPDHETVKPPANGPTTLELSDAQLRRRLDWSSGRLEPN